MNTKSIISEVAENKYPTTSKHECVYHMSGLMYDSLCTGEKNPLYGAHKRRKYDEEVLKIINSQFGLIKKCTGIVII